MHQDCVCGIHFHTNDWQLIFPFTLISVMEKLLAALSLGNRANSKSETWSNIAQWIRHY